ncbi:uncharacterized protein LOC117338451 [Pecten maximus]|uniref:uncharacterized protein LOC117338451 n=1 Tax=Pecten maximus TaxID=6579 RepID=UPI0014589E5E|nr:uncharacterized protein LOC117338451 [Pecten maximus]
MLGCRRKRTVFQGRPRKRRFIAQENVAGALVRPKPIRTCSNNPYFGSPQRLRFPKQTIAFHVALSTSKDVHDSTIVYDQVKLDTGHGYNQGDGIYIVPEAGTYVFTWTSICNVYDVFQTVLAVDGAQRGSSFKDARDRNVAELQQTTAVVILVLNQGDHVFIRMGNVYDHGTFISLPMTYGESTFSGWKLD